MTDRSHLPPPCNWCPCPAWGAECENTRSPAEAPAAPTTVDPRRRIAELEADRERLGADLDVYREEVRTLQEQMETIAYNRTWPHDRERPAEIRRELDRVSADARGRAAHVVLQYRAAQVRWQRQREQLTAEVEQLRAVVADLRALCRDHQAEASGGGMTDASAVWPSEILAVLDGGQP